MFCQYWATHCITPIPRRQPADHAQVQSRSGAVTQFGFLIFSSSLWMHSEEKWKHKTASLLLYWYFIVSCRQLVQNNQVKDKWWPTGGINAHDHKWMGSTGEAFLLLTDVGITRLYPDYTMFSSKFFLPKSHSISRAGTTGLTFSSIISLPIMMLSRILIDFSRK